MLAPLNYIVFNLSFAIYFYKKLHVNLKQPDIVSIQCQVFCLLRDFSIIVEKLIITLIAY